MQHTIRTFVFMLWLFHYQLASHIGPYEPLKIPALNYSVQYKSNLTQNLNLFYTISSSNMIYLLQNSILYAFPSETGDNKIGGWQWQSSSTCIKEPLLYEPDNTILSNSLIFLLCIPNNLYSLNATDGSIVNHLVLDVEINFDITTNSLMSLSPSFPPEIYIPASSGFVAVDIALKQVTFVYSTPTALLYSTVLAIKETNTQDIVLFFANMKRDFSLYLFLTYSNGSTIYKSTNITSSSSDSLIFRASSSLYEPAAVYIAAPQTHMGGVWKYSISSNIPKWSWMVPRTQSIHDIVLDEKRGRMYVICNSVFSLSLENGKQLWELDPLSGFWGLSHAVLDSNGILYTIGHPLSAVNVAAPVPLIMWSHEYVLSINNSIISMPTENDYPKHLIIPTNRQQLIAISEHDNKINVRSFVAQSYPTCPQLESKCSLCAHLLEENNIRQCGWCSSLGMCIEYVGLVNRTLYHACAKKDMATNSIICHTSSGLDLRGIWWIAIIVVCAGLLVLFFLYKKYHKKKNQVLLLTQQF